MNYKTLSDALAARFAPGVVTPPSGYLNIRASTAQAPNAIPSFPYVVVWPQTGDFTVNPGTLYGEHEFLVVFHYAKADGDQVRQLAALESWLGVLIDQLMTVNKLGVTGVRKTLPMKYDYGVIEYAGVKFEAITLTVHIWTEEAWQVVPT